jgi:hypothetical protein
VLTLSGDFCSLPHQNSPFLPDSRTKVPVNCLFIWGVNFMAENQPLERKKKALIHRQPMGQQPSFSLMALNFRQRPETCSAWTRRIADSLLCSRLNSCER